MRGTCVFTLGGVQLYGVVVTHDHGIRVRVSTPEISAVNLSEGQEVRIALPGQMTKSLLVTSVTALETGNTWACLAPPIKARMVS